MSAFHPKRTPAARDRFRPKLDTSAMERRTGEDSMIRHLGQRLALALACYSVAATAEPLSRPADVRAQ
jgi:hypothetical protein